LWMSKPAARSCMTRITASISCVAGKDADGKTTLKSRLQGVAALTRKWGS